MTFLAKRPQGIFAGFDDDPVMVAGLDDEPTFVGEYTRMGDVGVVGGGLQLIGAVALGFFAVRTFMKAKGHHQRHTQRRAARRAYGFRS